MKAQTTEMIFMDEQELHKIKAVLEKEIVAYMKKYLTNKAKRNILNKTTWKAFGHAEPHYAQRLFGLARSWFIRIAEHVDYIPDKSAITNASTAGSNRLFRFLYWDMTHRDSELRKGLAQGSVMPSRFKRTV